MKKKAAKAKSKQAPLSGITVVDASRVLAGPYCAQILADLGAKVIKIERPGTGDETRGWGPPFNPSGTSAYFMSVNRGKKGMRLDLSQKKDQVALRKILKTVDVLVENFRSDSVA